MGRLDDEAVTALVLEARAGTRDAFGRLYEELAPLVRHVVGDNVHVRADVDDVVQEVFVRAFQRLSALREPDRFRPWLLAIARRCAIDHRRMRVAGRLLPDADAGLTEPSRQPSPEETAAARDELARVRRATAAMSPRDVLALDLVGHLGFGPAEVAAVLGVSPGAAKVVVHRARQKLLAALPAGDAPDPQPGRVRRRNDGPSAT